MAISDTITSMQNHLKNAYEKVSEKGGTVPSEKNMANLSEAIGSVPSGDNTLLNSLIDRSITEISNDEVKSVGKSSFNNCEKLTSVNFTLCTVIYDNAFQNCTKLTSVNLPICSNINSYVFYNCSKLSSLNLPLCSNIGYHSLEKCSSLTTLIIRSSSVCVLAGTNTFNSTPIATSTTEGFIYVPDGLVESYKSATNWSTYASKIKPISDLGE